MDRNLKKLVNFWMDEDEYERVRQKADRDHVNLSSLLRDYLRQWAQEAPGVQEEKSEQDAEEAQ